jgi:hypothetical protein
VAAPAANLAAQAIARPRPARWGRSRNERRRPRPRSRKDTDEIQGRLPNRSSGAAGRLHHPGRHGRSVRVRCGCAAAAAGAAFRAGLSYTTFLSNSAFGGTPEGFSLRVNHIVGINAAYFIGQSTDDGLHLQAMFHIKQQGVTNQATGDHEDLDSLAAGFELGYLWKVYKGLYVAPRIGALYYLDKPQGPDNAPVMIGDRSYDNPRHKNRDTHFIPTLSVGCSW